MPHWPKQLGSKPIDFGLERILALLERLGNPHHRLPPVVHYAGTNGKGSTVAFSRAILEAAGYRVHVYTSPHLLDFNERIVLAGQEISDDMLSQIAEECRIACDDIRVTFFEGTTAMAYLAFAQVEADIVLLETGMGGRLDATNVIDQPACTVITPISLDHTEYLGPTLPIIAGEKVGILKPGVPCVASLQTDDVHAVIEQKAEELGCPLFSFGYDWIAEKTENGMAYRSQRGDLDLPLPSLLGDHQIINAGTALTALKCLEGFTIPDSAIAQGLTRARWMARMQQLTSGALLKRLPADWEIWIDGAHNPGGTHVVSCIIEDWTDKPTYLICGFTKGRDAVACLQPFVGKAAFVGGILIETEMAAQNAETVRDAALSLGFASNAFESVEEVLHYLPTLSSAPARVVFCGSLYLASDVLKANRG